MMTFFARHTRKMDIDADTRERLWREHWVAIHHPTDRSGNRDTDSRSTDPNDYAGANRKAMKALATLATEGGYVCAEHHGHKDVQVGQVDPDSGIQLLTGKWGDLHGNTGRTAILKAVPLRRVRLIAPSGSAVILVGRPRQGTLMRWPNAGALVADLVEGRDSAAAPGLLSPDQQEIMCSEFLRQSTAVAHALPQLAHLVLPVGRTMKDIDIYGLATDGLPLFAQVTYLDLAASWEKLNRLVPYGAASGAHLILFCNVDAPTVTGGVKVFPIRTVFETFTATEAGRQWLTLARGR